MASSSRKRYMQRYLALTLACRGESQGAIAEANVFGQTANALTKVCDMRPIDAAYLLRMKMITRTPNGNIYLVRHLEAGAGEATQEDSDDESEEGEPSHGPQGGVNSAEYLQLRAQIDILNDNKQQMRAQLDIIRANQDEMRNQMNLMNASMQSYFTQFPPPPPPQ